MIDLARGNPAFRAVIDRALIGEPDAILLVEFIGETREEPLRRLRDLVALVGDLGLPGSVVEMTDPGAQKALWDVRKAGLNIMMSMKGDGKPVSFIEDCAVPLEHLAEYVDRLTQVFARHGTRGTWYAHASVGTLHVRPILDMRRDGAAKMRAIAEEASAMVREYKGAFSGEHGDGLVRSEWVGWQFGPRLSRAFEEIKDLFDPAGLMNPGKIVRGTKMDDASLFRFPPGYRIQPMTTALDWSAWNVQNDAVTGALTPAGTGGDPAGGFAKAVEMCNNNGHCRKFDAGTMCPSYRATRDEDASHARPCEHAAAGAVGKVRRGGARLRRGARGARPLRELQGLPARMPDRRRHGEDEDRSAAPAGNACTAFRFATGSSRICRGGRRGPRACHGSRTFATAFPGMAKLSEAWLGFSARRSLPAWRGDTFLRDATPRVPAMPARAPTSCCSSTRSPTISSPRTRMRR